MNPGSLKIGRSAHSRKRLDIRANLFESICGDSPVFDRRVFHDDGEGCQRRLFNARYAGSDLGRLQNACVAQAAPSCSLGVD
jgi:hypothetical protein